MLKKAKEVPIVRSLRNADCRKTYTIFFQLKMALVEAVTEIWNIFDIHSTFIMEHQLQCINNNFYTSSYVL